MCFTYMWKLMFSVFWMPITLRQWIFLEKVLTINTCSCTSFSQMLISLKSIDICQSDLDCQTSCFWCIFTSISQIIGYLKKKKPPMEFWLFVLKDGYLYDVSDEIIILSTVVIMK